jgi:hypothetical protein
MNKFAEITVIRFKSGITAETFNSDDDFVTGTMTRNLAGKSRIVWDLDSSVEWVNSDMLVKLDKDHMQYKLDLPVESDESGKANLPV